MKKFTRYVALFFILLLPWEQVFCATPGIPPVPKRLPRVSIPKASQPALPKVPLTPSPVSQTTHFSTPLSPEISAQVTKTLKQRVQTSAKLFEQTRAISPEINPYFSPLRFVSGKSLSQNLTSLPQMLYPQVPYLQNQEQLSLYFLARNNREQARWYPQVVAQYQEIGRRINDFKQAQTLITHPIEQDISWVADQLPKDISYLLVGECHYLPDIANQVAQLIRHLHYVTQPERKIIVLTEFLQEGVAWGTPGPVTTWETYVDLFKQLHNMEIPVMGMEPPLKFKDFTSEIVTEEPESTTKSFIANISEETDINKVDEKDTSRQVASSLEGVRFRNEHFLKTIQQVRQEHPDVLLVIYTGGAHVEYSQPYSLGDALAGPQTRVITLIPAPVKIKGVWEAPATNFDVATKGQFFFDGTVQSDEPQPTRLIQFNDPELIRLSGADIRWRIPITQGIK